MTSALSIALLSLDLLGGKGDTSEVGVSKGYAISTKISPDGAPSVSQRHRQSCRRAECACSASLHIEQVSELSLRKLANRIHKTSFLLDGKVFCFMHAGR